MPDEMDRWPTPMRLHVESEQHQLWRARRPSWQGTPRLYEEHLADMLRAAVPLVSVVFMPVSTNGKGA